MLAEVKQDERLRSRVSVSWPAKHVAAFATEQEYRDSADSVLGDCFWNSHVVIVLSLLYTVEPHGQLRSSGIFSQLSKAWLLRLVTAVSMVNSKWLSGLRGRRAPISRGPGHPSVDY
jgi:hypothetical protein